jgi:hypothetical protein
VIGKTWIALAHPAVNKIDAHGNFTFGPGIFSVFMPTAIEYVITGKETEKKLADLEKRGITLVDVVKISDQQQQQLI